MDDEEYYGGQLDECATPGLMSELGPFLDPGLPVYGYDIQIQPTVDPQDTILAGGSSTTVGLTHETDQHESPTTGYATEYLDGTTETCFTEHEGIPGAEHLSQTMVDVASWAVPETGYLDTPSFSAEYAPHTVDGETQTASAHNGNQVTPY
jgi:hypothetical protein